MRGIGQIFKNHVRRIIQYKGYLFVTLSLILISITFAIFITTKMEMKGNIAIVTESSELPINTELFHVQVMEEVPPLSQLVRKKYDAVIIDKIDQGEGIGMDQGSTRYEIITLKNDQYKDMLQQYIDHPEIPLPVEGKRGVGTNVLGFMMMFILLQGLMFMNLFSEDKLNGTLRRTVISPAGIGSYLIAQFMFSFMLIYLPTFLLLFVLKGLLHFEIGFGLQQYGWLLFLLSFLATAFGFMMIAWIEQNDNAISLASSIIIITSLLSGSFYTITHEQRWMDKITDLFPQKHFVAIAQDLEQNGGLINYVGEIGYIFTLSIAMLTIGWLISRSRFHEGQY